MGQQVLDYQRPPTQKARRLRAPGEELTKLSGIATLFILYGWEGNPDRSPMFLAMGMVLWCAVAVAAGWYKWLRPKAKDAHSNQPGFAPLWRGLVICLFLLSLAWLPIATRHTRTCYHDSRWFNRHFGIAWSDNGGPCGNGYGKRYGRAWRIHGNWYLYRTSHWYSLGRHF